MDFSTSAEKTLRKKGVHVVVDTFVDQIEDKLVTAGEKTYPGGTIIWAAGIKGAPLPGLPHGAGNRIPVDDTLQVPDHPGVFALGDIAHATPDPTRAPSIVPEIKGPNL